MAGAHDSQAFDTNSFSTDAYDIDGSSSGRRPYREAPPVKYRTTQWDTLVGRVDPRVRNKKEIAYDVGAGINRRVFTETKPYE